VFDPGQVTQGRPVADQLILGRLDGTALRHARRHPFTPEEAGAAVAELRQIAAGRGDLLGEAAGILTGFYTGTTPEEAKAQTAAELLAAAGADARQAAQWAMEGRRRAELARKSRTPQRP
jgi:hypothetical protein